MNGRRKVRGLRTRIKCRVRSVEGLWPHLNGDKMKSFRVIGISAVFLILGWTAPADSRQEQQDKPKDQEKQQQQAKPARQDQPQANRQQDQQQQQRQRQDNSARQQQQQTK